MAKSIYCLAAIGFFYLLSCSNMEHNSSEQSVSFNPSNNSVYKYEYADKDEVVQGIGKSENKIKTTVQYKFAFLFKVMPGLNNSYKVSVSFISGEVENIAGGNKLTNSFEDSTYFHKKFDALTNCVFVLDVANNGQIVQIEGYDAYRDSCSSRHETSIGKDYIRNIFERIISVLPKRNLVEGASWKASPELYNEVRHLSSNFVLEKIDSSFAYIRYNSKIEQELKTMNQTLLMRGEEDSKIELEKTTGMLLCQTLKRNMEGSCNINGIPLVQNVVKKISIAGHRIS